MRGWLRRDEDPFGSAGGDQLAVGAFPPIRHNARFDSAGARLGPCTVACSDACRHVCANFALAGMDRPFNRRNSPVSLRRRLTILVIGLAGSAGLATCTSLRTAEAAPGGAGCELNGAATLPPRLATTSHSFTYTLPRT